MVPKNAISKNTLSMASNSGHPKTPCMNTSVRLPKCCGRTTLPAAWTLNGTDVSHKTPVTSYLDLPQMRQMRHIADTTNAFPATTSVPSVPFPHTIASHAVVHTETKPGHHVSPHTAPMPGQADRTQRRHKCTGISYENTRNRELCVSQWTKAKLTRSCASPNPGAITYTQFATGIPPEETGDAKD